MTATIHSPHTPPEAKGKYAVCRHWTSADGDFLHSLDDRYGACFAGVGRAMVFASKSDAVRAAIRAKQLVPVGTDGVRFFYDAVLLA